jgi:hypothetical protein
MAVEMEKDAVVVRDVVVAVATRVEAAVAATRVVKDAKADLNVLEVHPALAEIQKEVLLVVVAKKAAEAERKDLLVAAVIRTVAVERKDLLTVAAIQVAEAEKRKKHLEKVNSEINRTITL